MLTSLPLTSWDESRDPLRESQQEEFLGNDRDNPFARICCRTRKVIPTECDGTCCKRDRKEYTMTAPERLRSESVLQSGGDPDYHIPTIEEAQEIIRARIERVEKAKRRFFDEKYRVEARVSLHLAEQEKRATPPTLH